MQLNWKVRIRNKLFWLALIPAVLILAETVCRLFGLSLETGDLKEQLLNLVNAVFAVLAVLGIVVDPTTEGVGDSDRAMLYREPWSDADLMAEDPVAHE
ncbi:MAG: phage holin [Oscillospiraceae bacterium]|nr:phage holin [Oscillospiraceae bacterium]